MKNQKRSQASIEYLSTYAFAFIAIVTAIGALYYFGFLDFSRYLPQKCVFPSQFRCLDFSLNTGEVRIKLDNNLGENICIKTEKIKMTNDAIPSISCSFVSSGHPQGSCAANEFEWASTKEKDFVFKPCSGGAYISNERIELKVTMEYYAINTPTHPLHTINGKISGRVLS